MRLGGLPVGLVLVLWGVASSAPRISVKTRGLASVEVDAGRDRGLAAGDRLQVALRGGGRAEMEVLRVGATSAACRVLGTPGTIRIGDAVFLLKREAKRNERPSAPADPPKAAPVGAPAPSATPWPPSPAPTTAVAAPTAAAAPAAAHAIAAPPKPRPLPAPTPETRAAPVAPPPRAFASMRPEASLAPDPAPSPTPAASVEIPERARSYRVTYRSAASVYLAGGRAQGLAVGDGLRVGEGRKEVGTLEVVYAAEQSASCKVIAEARPIREGDQAVVVSLAPRPAAQQAASSAPAAASSAAAVTSSARAVPAEAGALTGSSGGRRLRGRWLRLRGAASLGYYRSWDGTESGLDFEQRTARVDLGLYDIGALPLTFTLRARSRQDIRARTLSSRTPARERNDRLYELSLRYDPASEQVGLELGRIAGYKLAGIGYLDGALVHVLVLPSVHLGAFGGRVAEVDGLVESGDRKLGGFIRLAPAGRYAAGWYDATLAFVREDAEGDLSREYLSLESRFGRGSRFSLFQRAELDLNRGWRRDLSDRALQLSNVSLSANLRASSSVWAFVSYDGRRNYRYVRNRLVPEEVFDDLLQQGLRAGFNLMRAGGFGATASAGMSLKEKDPRHPELDLANAYSVNAGLRHADLFGFSLGVDASGFSNGYTGGALVSARLGRSFPGGHLLDLSYGRSLYRVRESQEDRETQWLRLVGRAELPWRLFLLADAEYDMGDDLSGPRGLLELGVAF